MIGFLFPGQGSQSVGMGKDLYENFESVKTVYNDVKNLTGIDVAKISFEGPEEILNKTKYTQISILTMSLSILKLLEEKNIKAQMSCGLSLGEYSSLIYSGAISFEDGVKIVQKRGELMEDLCPEGDWAMAAVLGLSDEQVESLCKKIDGFLKPVNYNSPGQVVVSGDKESIEKLISIGKENGARKIVQLKTSGPFHTEKLVEASKSLKEFLNEKDLNLPKIPVIKNLDGKPYSDSDDIREILSKHVMSPTRMSDSIKYMIDSGVDTFVEIGPGKTLSGFVTSINRGLGKDLKIISINSLESFNQAINIL